MLEKAQTAVLGAGDGGDLFIGESMAAQAILNAAATAIDRWEEAEDPRELRKGAIWLFLLALLIDA